MRIVLQTIALFLLYPLSFPLWTLVKEHDMPSDIQDDTSHDPVFNGKGIGVTDQLNTSMPPVTSWDRPENSHRSAHHATTTGESMSMPLPAEGPTAPQARTRHRSVSGLSHQAAGSEGVHGDSRAYAPSPPFEEAGPKSSVWCAYLDKSREYDTNMVAEQRGELNILLVFAGLFSAVVSNFLTLSMSKAEPDYQAMSAFLLFDLINIQLALANGTSADNITTSGTNPYDTETLNLFDMVQWFWFTSLTLSLVTAFFAILVDAWYFHYVSPIPGQPKVRARTRHLRYKGLDKWNVRHSICVLQVLLHFSLIAFAFGLALSDFDVQAYFMPYLIFIVSYGWYLLSSALALIHPECPWKTPLTHIFSWWRQYPPIMTIPGLTSSLEIKNLSEVNKVHALEIYAAHKSHIETEIDALRWLYDRSSTSATLVIHALAGLSSNCIARVEEVFSPRWVEIQDEKERMLMDCMELTRDGTTRWIPRDIPNIGSRIEPLLRLEILFPSLRRKYPSRLFGEYNLDFSMPLSNALSLTLSAIDDAHIRKPMQQNQVIMDAFADNSVHHPIVWEKLLDRYQDKERLIHSMGNGLTIETCIDLVTRIYFPEDSPPETYSCTLAYPLITSHKQEILTRLLTFFPTSDPHNDTVSLERRLPLIIICALVPDSAPSTINSHQPHLFRYDSTVSKYRLLHVALHAIHKYILSAIDPPSKEWRTHIFWATLSYIKSELFSRHALSYSEYWEVTNTFWECCSYALVCMAFLVGGNPKYCAIEWKLEWANKDLFLNILQVIHDERAAEAPFLHPVPELDGAPDHVDSIIGVVSWLLGDAFKHGIPSAYKAVQEQGGLGYFTEKCCLQPKLIQGLCGYITGLSDAKKGLLPHIQSDDILNQHIEDLHQAPVILCTCMSITLSNMPPHPILSTLASIDPYHHEWPNILQTLNSPDHEYSVQRYIPHSADKITNNYWKYNMKYNVSFLAKCLKSEKCHNRENNQPSTSSNNLAGGLKTHHRSGSTVDPNMDVELAVLRSENVDGT